MARHLGAGEDIWGHVVPRRPEAGEPEVCQRLLETRRAIEGADTKLQRGGELRIPPLCFVRLTHVSKVWKKHGFDGVICPVQASPPIPNG